MSFLLKVVLAAGLIVIGIAPFRCFAAPSLEKRHQIMAENLKSRQSDVSDWIVDQKNSMVLVFAVGALGLIIGACQTNASPWSRVATVLLGLLVSTITLCTNTFFPADYQTLRRAIHSVRPLMESMKNKVAIYDSGMSESDFSESEKAFYEASAKFDTVSDSVLGLSSKKDVTAEESRTQSLLLWHIQPVFAQDQSNLPSWVYSDGQSNALGTYFVGSYTDTSLEKARSSSMDFAVRRGAERYLHDHPGVAGQSALIKLTPLVTQFGTVTDTWIERKGTVYTFYTRLLVSSKVNDVVVAPSSSDEEGATPQSDNCTWTNLGQGRSLHFTRSASSFYVYLEAQHRLSKGDVSDLVATDTDPESLDDAVSDLHKLAESHPESTKRLTMPSKETRTITISGHTYTIMFQSHAFKKYGRTTVCLVR